MDGTWNGDPPLPGVLPTNVLQIARLILPRDAAGTPQQVIYQSGLGYGSAVDYWAAYPGWGIRPKLEQAVDALRSGYEAGDEVFLFGGSRGAWIVLQTARRVPAPIRFLGAFDTVAALGLPLPLLRWLTKSRLPVGDGRLPANIAAARQALAYHDARVAFEPIVWTGAAPGADVEQRWFPGNHADVVGGFGKSKLAHHTLNWMLDAAAACGLAIDEAGRSELSPDPTAAPSAQNAGPHRFLPKHSRRPGKYWPATETFDPALKKQRRDVEGDRG